MSAVAEIRRKSRPLAARRRQRHATTDGGWKLDATVFHTELGWMAVASGDHVVRGVVFGYPSESRALDALATYVGNRVDLSGAPRWLDDLARQLADYAAGGAVDFSDVPLALDHLTEFGRRVVSACRDIPRGEVRSYGALAEACGAAGAARAVGSVMARNRYPLIVPCHRVVGAAGSLGGYSAPDGLAMKRRLLAMEAARPHSTRR